MKKKTALWAAPVSLAFALAAVGIGGGHAYGTGTLDQSNWQSVDEGFIAGGGTVAAQTFTAGLTGTLDQVDLDLFVQGSPGDLTVQITAVSGGHPAAPVLASATVTPASVSSSGFTSVSVPFSPGATSVAGMQYAIVLSAPSGDANFNSYSAGATGFSDFYAGGHADLSVDSGKSWALDPGTAFDLLFKTYVSPPPDTDLAIGTAPNLATIATGPSGANVSYTAPSTTDPSDSTQTATVSCDHGSGSLFPIGTTTVTCTASDGDDINAPQSNFTVTVGYAFNGFFQPINDPPGTTPSVFKGGSTVPVKFSLAYASGALVDDTTAANIASTCGATFTATSTGAGAGTVDETPSTVTPTAGNCFRYDSTAHQFIFNWGTKGLATGSYTLKAIVRGSGATLATHSVNVGLR